MIVRNFNKPGYQEQVTSEQLAQIAIEPGNLGRCLVALESATKEELIKLTMILPESNNIRFSAKQRLESLS